MSREPLPLRLATTEHCARGDATCPVIGTAVVDGLGGWSVRQEGSAATAARGDSIAAGTGAEVRVAVR